MCVLSLISSYFFFLWNFPVLDKINPSSTTQSTTPATTWQIFNTWPCSFYCVTIKTFLQCKMNLFTWFPRRGRLCWFPHHVWGLGCSIGLFPLQVQPRRSWEDVPHPRWEWGMREGWINLWDTHLRIDQLEVGKPEISSCWDIIPGFMYTTPLIILKLGENLVLAGREWYFSVFFGKSWATWGELDLSSCSCILQFWAAEPSGEYFSALRCYQIGKTVFILEYNIQRTVNCCVCTQWGPDTWAGLGLQRGLLLPSRVTISLHSSRLWPGNPGRFYIHLYLHQNPTGAARMGYHMDWFPPLSPAKGNKVLQQPHKQLGL